MNEYLQDTEDLIHAVGNILTEEDMAVCEETALDIYNALAEACLNKGLNFQQMLFSSLTAHHAILEVAIEEIKEQRNLEAQ